MSDTPRQEEQGIWIPPGARVPRTDETPVVETEPEAEPQTGADEPAIDYQDKYLRAVAELDTLRRRHVQQRQDAIERANEEFIRGLLPVLDAIERGLGAARQEASVESLQAGLELVSKQLTGFLQAHGVELIEAEIGQPFDPEVHEAMLRGPAGEVPEDHISAVLEQGFRLHGRVIRAAKVAVAAAPLDTEA